MKALLRYIGLRQARAHPGRTALAAGGVGLGVALVLAIQVINQAALGAFRQTIEGTAGRAQLQVAAASEGGLPEAVLEQVRAVPGIGLAVPFIEGTAFVADGRGESVSIFGVDLADEGSVRTYEGIGADAEEVIEDPLVFLSQPDSVVVTRAFAAVHHLALGDQIPVIAATGRRALTVRGLLEARGIARIYGASLAIMDIFAAQRLFRKDGRFDRIDVVLSASVDAETATAALRGSLPSDLVVERPAQRGEQIEVMLRAFQGMLTSVSAIALMVAVFIIYNSLATAVVERRHEIGVLRALGARRREVLGLHLGEALGAGAVGAVGGSLLGLGLAYLLAGALTNSAATTLGLPLAISTLGVGPSALAVAVGAGLLAAGLAGALPALAAARVPPIEAIRQHEPPVTHGWGGRALVAGLGLAVVATLCLGAEMRSGIVALGLVADVSLQLGMVLLSVPAVLLSARGMRPLAARLFGVSGWLAGESSLRMPARTAATVAALGLGLSMSTAMATAARSFEVSVGDWLHSWTDRDLFVTSATRERGLVGSPFAEDLAIGLRAVPGVRRVENFRLIRQQYEGDTIAVAAASLTGLSRKQIWVSDSFSLRYHKGVGDGVRLATPHGPRSFRITEVRRAYDSDRGTVIIAYATFREVWDDRLVTHFGIDLVPGAERAAVRAEILRRFGADYRIQVLEPQALQAQVLAGVAQTFSFTWGVEAVTLLVAFLGIFDTVLAGVLARRREIGVLRALGCLRRQVAIAFGLEGLQIGVLGATLGLAAGLVLSLMWILVLFRDTIGYLVDVHVPGGRLALVALTALALAVGAAALPARRAARVAVAEALTHE